MRPAAGLRVGITIGVVIALVIAGTLSDTFRIKTAEVPDYPAGSFNSGFSTPGDVLRYSRWEFTHRNLTTGLGYGLFFGVVFWLLDGIRLGLTFGILAALTGVLSFSVTAAIVGVATGGRMRGVPAWPAYEFVRIILKLQRRVPWRLMRFLDDAHRLGIVRQAGAVYQFRHATLQDHLADAYDRSPRRRPPRAFEDGREDLGFLFGKFST